jgi:competence protein ComEC
MSEPLKIYIWDVEHGNAITIKTPEGKVVMIDCGTKPRSNFSPAIFIKNAWDVDNLDYLIVSHPHLDHIRDLRNVITVKPKVLESRPIDISKLLTTEYKSNEEIIREYVNFEQRYSGSVATEKDPDTWSVKFLNFFPNVNDDNINNLSIVTFVSYGNFTLLHPGDLEKAGWENLLGDIEFVNILKKTNFLIASHHGLDSGYLSDIFQHFTPKLTIISDGRYNDTSAKARYYENTEGWDVHDSGQLGKEERRVVSTRNDGRIYIGIEIMDSSTSIYVDRKTNPKRKKD